MKKIAQCILLVCFCLLWSPVFGEQPSSKTTGDASHLLDDTVQLEIGDQIQYLVTEDREEPLILFVDEKGNIEVPLLGTFQAKGLTSRDLALQIKKALEVDYYYRATVQISQYSGDGSRGQVFILGQVLKQGPLDIPRGEVLTVSKAILRAGGFTKYSDPSRVSLIRRDSKDSKEEVRMEVNVAEILDTGKFELDVVVQANDMIFVAQRGDTSGRYTVTGAVKAPGLAELPVGATVTVSQAILQAGGFTDFANQRKVKLVRHGADGSREEIIINVQKILEEGVVDDDLLIRKNDMIIVPESLFNF